VLPVILMLHEPRSGKLFQGGHQRRPNYCDREDLRIEVPSSKTLDAGAADELQLLSRGTPYQQRLNRLVLDKPLMRIVANGRRRLFLEAGEWINKSSDRRSLRIVAQGRFHRLCPYPYLFARRYSRICRDVAANQCILIRRQRSLARSERVIACVGSYTALILSCRSWSCVPAALLARNLLTREKSSEPHFDV
jgi:hypothetical protein